MTQSPLAAPPVADLLRLHNDSPTPSVRHSKCVTQGSPSRIHQRLRREEEIETDMLEERPCNSPSPSLPAPSPTMSTKEEWTAITACFWCFFMGGWYDASTGPLLPTIQAHYGVNFTIVSMLFVSNCVGFISAAVINIYLTDRLGFGKVVFLGALIQVLAYALLVPAFPFPVMCFAYAMNGFGGALQDAQANGFVAGLPNNASAKMGLLHALYGAGAFIAPFVATQLAQKSWWSFHFLTSLVLSVINALALLIVFKLRRQTDFMGLPDSQAHENLHSPEGTNKYKEVFSSRTVQLMAFFILIYVGVEVSIGGWIVTFAIDERGGGPSAGYISSGFFGGLMIGRVALLWVNEKIGERRVIYVYCTLCIGLVLVIWLVPNLVINAISIAFAGLFLGAVIPRHILTESIGWIASFGQAGSAVFPFMTGALAQKHGVKVLQPLLLGMISALVMLWALIPDSKKRSQVLPRSESSEDLMADIDE